MTLPFKSLNLLLSLFVDASASEQFEVSVCTGVMSGKVLFCSCGALSVLVPSFTKRESRSYLVFLLIKISLSTSFEILSLSSTSLKVVRFLAICSFIDIVSHPLDFFLIDLVASKIISLTCSLTLLSTATNTIFRDLVNTNHQYNIL